MTKPDPSDRCRRVAKLPDPLFGEKATRTVICSKSIAHRTSDRADRREHFDSDTHVFWTDDEAL